MFEIELIICIKLNLALNNLQRLIWLKNPTNQTTKRLTKKISVRSQIISTTTSISVDANGSRSFDYIIYLQKYIDASRGNQKAHYQGCWRYSWFEQVWNNKSLTFDTKLKVFLACVIPLCITVYSGWLTSVSGN